MLRTTTFIILALALVTSVWGQMTVKNSSDDVLMQVDDQANVTIGSTNMHGLLTTYELKVITGAAAGRVLKSDADGLASWGTDEVEDADHVIGNETPQAGTAISVSDRTVSVNVDNSTIKVNHSDQLYADISVTESDPVWSSNDDDHAIGNEYQQLTESGNTITLSHGGGSVTDNIEDNQPLSEVLGDGNNASGRNAVNFGRLSVGLSGSDSRLRVEGHVSSSLPVWGTMNTSIYAKDVDSGNNESSISIIGIGKVLTSDLNDAHVGVQGVLVGGGSNDVWMASGALGHHDLTSTHNRLSGVSTTVKSVGSYPYQTNLKTFAIRGANENTGSDDWGILIDAHQNYLGGTTYVDDLFANNNVSASSFTDRTPYPKDLQTAYASVLSMQRLPQGEYRADDKRHQLDHSKLHPFIQSSDGEQRDLSATASAQNEVIKDLLQRIERLEALLDVATAE